MFSSEGTEFSAIHESQKSLRSSKSGLPVFPYFSPQNLRAVLCTYDSTLQHIFQTVQGHAE